MFIMSLMVVVHACVKDDFKDDYACGNNDCLCVNNDYVCLVVI